MMVSASIERELASRLFPVRTGVFVAVTGPSGSGKDTLIAYARDVDLDPKRFAQLLRDMTVSQQLGRDRRLAAELKITRTPALFINGHRVVTDGPLEVDVVRELVRRRVKRESRDSKR